MKLNIANPSHGRVKKFLIEEEQKIKLLHDHRIADEINGDNLGEQFKGYVFKITGGNDKDGFPMMQGVMTAERVRLLIGPQHSIYHEHRRQKRRSTRKRKSVRGCITSNDTSQINCVIVKKGAKDIPGLTDPESELPKLMGPKRASKIRKLWNLTKDEDPVKFVIKRSIPKKGKRKTDRVKAPKVQRLVTPHSLSRQRHKLAERKAAKDRSTEQKNAYEKMIAAKRDATRSKRLSKLSKRRDEPAGAAGAAKPAAAAAPKAAPKEAKQPAKTEKVEKPVKKVAEKGAKAAVAPAPAKAVEKKPAAEKAAKAAKPAKEAAKGAAKPAKKAEPKTAPKKK